MAKRDDISSTEKLLAHIRAEGDSGADQDFNAQPEPIESTPKKSGRSGKGTTVGVTFAPEAIRLLRVRGGGTRGFEILAFKHVPLEPGTTRDSHDFPDFFKTVLNDFCGPAKSEEIWTLLDAEMGGLSYLRIPKVSSKQIAQAVQWTYKQESAFDENSDVFDYQVHGEVVEDGVEKIAVSAYSAPANEINSLKLLFRNCGYPLTGISLLPLVFQNFYHCAWLDAQEQCSCSLHIEHEKSRIHIYDENGMLLLSRGIRTGMNSLMEAVRLEVDNRSSQIDFPDAGGMDGFSDQGARPTADASGPLPSSAAGGADIAQPPESELLDLMRPALERLVNQVERTMRHFALNFGNRAVAKIFISGQLSTVKSIPESIAEQLGVECQVVDPFVIAAAPSKPSAAESRTLFVPTAAAALSANPDTPNFLYTYRHKQQETRVKKANRYIFAAFLAALLVCGGIFFWQSGIVGDKQARLDALENELASFVPNVGKEDILKLMAETTGKRKRLKQYADKYYGMAVLSELAQMAHADIRLMNVESIFRGKSDQAESETEADTAMEGEGEAKPGLRLEGIVTGDFDRFESALAEYMLRLKLSPLFAKPVIEKRVIEYYENREVMRFTAQLKLN